MTMKKTIVPVLPLLLILALLIVGCGQTSSVAGGQTSSSSGGQTSSGTSGKTSSGGDEYTTTDVTMGEVDFTHHKLTITAETTVNFLNETSGSTHILCIGENGSCHSEAPVPAKLTTENGMEVDPGQTKSVRFDEPAIYKITCTLHPAMNLVITVEWHDPNM